MHGLYCLKKIRLIIYFDFRKDGFGKVTAFGSAANDEPAYLKLSNVLKALVGSLLYDDALDIFDLFPVEPELEDLDKVEPWPKSGDEPSGND